MLRYKEGERIFITPPNIYAHLKYLSYDISHKILNLVHSYNANLMLVRLAPSFALITVVITVLHVTYYSQELCH